jgi:hypothetical protein
MTRRAANDTTIIRITVKLMCNLVPAAFLPTAVPKVETTAAIIVLMAPIMAGRITLTELALRELFRLREGCDGGLEDNVITRSP